MPPDGRAFHLAPLSVVLGFCGFAAATYGVFFAHSDRAPILLTATCLSITGAGTASAAWLRGEGSAGRWLVRWRVARAVAVALVLIAVLIAVVVYVYTPPHTERGGLIGLLFAALFSGAVGFAELTERYRDDPARLLATDPTIIYVGVNISAAVAALTLIKEFEVFSPDRPHREIYEVLLASFGSIAFFRSSFFTARVDDKDVDVGPSTLLKSLLETSDRMINRSQARDRADDAASIMSKVSFDKAKAALPTLCFTVVEDITREQQEGLAASINQLASSPGMDDAQRSLILGTYLMRVVGPVVLARAVLALWDSISR